MLLLSLPSCKDMASLPAVCLGPAASLGHLRPGLGRHTRGSAQISGRAGISHFPWAAASAQGLAGHAEVLAASSLGVLSPARSE